MIQKEDILLHEVAEALSVDSAPEVDVTARVMEAIGAQPAGGELRMRVVRRVTLAAAACLMALLAVNLTLFFSHDYDEEALGRMVAKVYDGGTYFDGYADCTQAIEFYYSDID